MKIKTARLEEKAKMEEQMLAAIGNQNNNNVGKTIEVNDMYIESIKAKLMMLDNI